MGIHMGGLTLPVGVIHQYRVSAALSCFFVGPKEYITVCFALCFGTETNWWSFQETCCSCWPSSNGFQKKSERTYEPSTHECGITLSGRSWLFTITSVFYGIQTHTVFVWSNIEFVYFTWLNAPTLQERERERGRERESERQREASFVCITSACTRTKALVPNTVY